MPGRGQHQVDNGRVADQTPAAAGSLLLKEIEGIGDSKLTRLHRRGEVIFAEGQRARGISVLRSGRAKVSISSSEGKVLILRIEQAGAILGVNAVLRNTTYDLTVRTIESCRTDYIPRAAFMALLGKSEQARIGLAETLSRELTGMIERAKSLFLPQNTGEKLARLLVEWCDEWGEVEPRGTRLHNHFTQEEMAQMIGASRETVTRLLGHFSKRRLIQLEPNTIIVKDREALETVPLL